MNVHNWVRSINNYPGYRYYNKEICINSSIYMLQCKCETGGFAKTLNSWWIRENTGANAKPFYLKSYGWLII